MEDSPLIVRLPKGKAGEGVVRPRGPAEGVLAGLVGQPWAGQKGLTLRAGGAPTAWSLLPVLQTPYCPSPPSSFTAEGCAAARPHCPPALCGGCSKLPQPSPAQCGGGTHPASNQPAGYSPIQKLLVLESVSGTSLVGSRRPR